MQVADRAEGMCKAILSIVVRYFNKIDKRSAERFGVRYDQLIELAIAITN